MHNTVTHTNFFQDLPVPCLLLSGETGAWRVADVNQAYLHASGLQQEALLGKEMGNISIYGEAIRANPLFNRRLEASLAALLQGGHPVDIPVFSFPSAASAGHHSFWKISHSLLPAPAGQAPCLMHILTEVAGPADDGEDELLRLSSRLAPLSKDSMEMLCSMDEEGRFVTVSPSSEKLLGYTPAELEGKSFIDKVFPEDQAFSRETARRVMTGIETAHCENRYIAKDGTLVPLIWSARWDPERKITFCVARNGTEKKKHEQALLKIQRQYNELFDSLPVYICVLRGPEHIIDQANPMFYRFFGREEIVGKTMVSAFPEFATQEVIRQLDEVYRTGKPYEAKEAPLTLITQGGRSSRTVYRNVFYRAYCNDDGQVEGVFIFGIDVTESILSRKQAEQSSERYELVTRATFDAVWDWDIENDKTYYGAGFETIFGYTQDGISTKKTDWEAYIHPDDIQRVLDGIYRKLETNEDTWIDKYRYLRADGEYCFVMDRAVILRDRNGKANRMIGAMRDVTDEAKREEQARMIYRIAGHFNNEPDLEAAMDKTIREVLQFTGGVVAECWTMDYSGSALLLTAQASVRENIFRRNEATKFLISEGLPGQVWLNRSMVYVADLAEDPHFSRKDFAGKNNLVSAIGVPLFYRNKLLGVLTTYSDKPIRQNQFKLVGQDVLNRLAENMQRKIMETEMNLFFDLTPDLLVVAGTDGYFKKLNPAFIKTLGYSQMELLSMPFLNFVPMENRQLVEEMIGKLSLGETILNVEISLLAKSGSLVQLSWSAIMAFKEQLIIGTAKDITERKIAQMEVLNRNRRITELLESIGDGFYALDRDWKVEYWNNRAEEILEIKKEAVLGKVFWDVFPKKDFPELAEYYEAAREDGKARHFERYNVALDKWFDISVYPAANSVISVFFRDVTQKVNYIKAVEEQNEKLQSIAWTQSHKVRAPLSRILGLVGLLKELGTDSPELPQIIEYLEVSSKELDQVIHEVVEHTGSVRPE